MQVVTLKVEIIIMMAIMGISPKGVSMEEQKRIGSYH